MASWKVEIRGKGIQKASIDKLVKNMGNKFGEGASVSVVNIDPPKSRADRLQAAFAMISDMRSEIEQLRDEMQEWYDSLPENLQSGEKADQIQQAIDSLEDIIGEVENLEGRDGDVEFPGMY